VARIPPDATGSNRQVAEHALFLMLAVAKQYPAAREAIKTNKVGWPKTISLVGKTLGMVGLGKTGEELAVLARGMGMRTIAVKRTLDDDLARRLGIDWLRSMESLPGLLAESDFVSIHLPLEPATVGFFNEACFSQMKRGSILVNIARGPIVNREALIKALGSGHIAGAGLDVLWQEPIDPNDEILSFQNVVATPHIAAQSSESQEKLAALVADNIKRVVAGTPPRFELTSASS
jgi:phosphoglycerate dehydrogenase-like enzyme